MKQMRFKWKYLLASLLLANNMACSNDDLAQLASRQEQDNSARTAELVTQTIVLDAAGTLEAKVSEAMGEAAVSTLQKLVVSGPFTSTDMQYVRDSLTSLTVLDMKGVQIIASDVPYKYNNYYGAQTYFIDNQICKHMFYRSRLKDVVLPSTITSVGDNAFYYCDSLVSVEIPDDVTTIGAYAFSECRLLPSITLPSKLTTLGYYAFANCYSLNAITIPDSVKVIKEDTFNGCESLVSVVLPEKLETIERHAFRNCHEVESIQLPEGLKKIDYGAFAVCDNLRELTIPAGVESVGRDFVNGCSQLRTLVWNSTTLDVPFNSNTGHCLLFVKSDEIAVENMSNWNAVVINGVAETSIDVNYSSWYGDYVNAQEFMAKKLTYERYFDETTIPGCSSGWQTIVLPFTPDSIYHETKGKIAPFGSGIEGAKPFWLRELTSEGFVDVTKIEANKPYIIAMPNHSDYLDDYRLNGYITFVARDSVLKVTPAVLEPSVGPDFELHPTYSYVAPTSEPSFYILSSEWGYYEDDQMYYNKSLFKKDQYTGVQKFNAYVTTLGGGRSSRSTFELDTRSKETRAVWTPNKTGIPQIGDM